jgi:catechol 2,3-dioxygenase-like lactoylglutathione lyase family enzyme
MKPRLDLVGIVVQDMRASLDFYRLLGVSFPDGAEGDDHVEVTLEGGLRLAWDSAEVIRSIDPEWQPPTGGPAIGLAFLCGSPEEVDAVYAEIVAAGYPAHKEPWDAFWGQRYAQVRDPDHNVIDLFAPLPRS